MSPRNKEVIQDLLNDRIDIQEIEDRLFAVILLSAIDGLELDGQQLNDEQKRELSSYLVGEVFGSMGNSPKVLEHRLHDLSYLAKISNLLETTFANYKNELENGNE